MKKPPTPKLNRQILEEASEWFVDFRVGDVDAAARAHFDEWLRRSPEHIRAYWEIAKTYVELPDQSDFGKLDVAALIAYARSDDNVVPLNAGTQPNRPHGMAAADAPGQAEAIGRADGSIDPRRIPRRRLAAAVAAGVLIALAAGGFLWHASRFPTYSTDIGERRSITLADGSAVDLNARSSIRIEFSNSERRVELLRGQALFQVAKDKRRPFIVRTTEASVRAVGTQFDVYRKTAGTTVTVLEGEVAVYSVAHQDSTQSLSNYPTANVAAPPVHVSSEGSTNSASGAPRSINQSGAMAALPDAPAGLLDRSGQAAILLSAGEQVTVAQQVAIPLPQHADLTATTAWMQHRLIFDGTRLSDVVEEFNRYNRRQLVVEGSSLTEFHVSGVYSSTDPASLLRFLQDQPGIQITEGENEIRIETK
jgi:transmembrane sensor